MTSRFFWRRDLNPVPPKVSEAEPTLTLQAERVPIRQVGSGIHVLRIERR